MDFGLGCLGTCSNLVHPVLPDASEIPPNVIFHNRERIHAAMRAAQPAPPSSVAQAQLGNFCLKTQQFASAFDGMLRSDAGVYVGRPRFLSVMEASCVSSAIAGSTAQGASS